MNDMLLAGVDRAIHGFADRLNFRTIINVLFYYFFRHIPYATKVIDG